MKENLFSAVRRSFCASLAIVWIATIAGVASAQAVVPPKAKAEAKVEAEAEAEAEAKAKAKAEGEKTESVEAPRFDIKKHGAIVYHTGETYLVKLDVYQPVAEIKSDETMPAVVMIHGGAWRAGSKISMLRHARRLARVGYVAVVINYRLAPKYQWPAQIEDCRMALKWLDENADTYKVDRKRVGVYGYSAGAHLASMLATTNEENAEIKIRAAAAGGTPAEFSWIAKNANTLVYWLGEKRGDAPDVYLEASPTNYVTDDDPPFLIFHGISDRLVPVESARRLDKKLTNVGVESELIELPGFSHLGAFGKMDLMDDVIKFFDSHLKEAAPAK